MKNLCIVIICFITMLCAFSCYKSNNIATGSYSCRNTLAVQDSAALLAFAAKYGINAAPDTSWLYYQILFPGSGAHPVGTSKIYVRYAARFMDGTYFDSTATDREFELDSLILGWQYGLKKIESGGQIKLLIPSALAYGCTGSNGVAPNAPVYFNIYLDSLK